MRVGKPTPTQAEWLTKLGLPGLQNYDLPDAEVTEQLRMVRMQHGTVRHGHKVEPEEVLRARAEARVAYRHYGRRKMEEQAPHPYLQDLTRRATWGFAVIVALLLILLVLAILPGHAQTNKANPGAPVRANAFWWNGTAYVPVETANPLPVAIVSGGGSGGTASTFGAAFPATGTAIGVKSGANMVNLTADGSQNLNINCQTGCAGAAGGISSTATLGALNAVVTIALDKYTGVGFALTSGTLTGTITPQVSFDGGTTWKNTYFVDLSPATGNLLTASLNPASGLGYSIFLPTGATNAQVKVTAYTSGSVSATIRAMTANALPAAITVDWATGNLNFLWIDTDNGGARSKLYDGAGNNRAANVNAANELQTSDAVLKWGGGTLGAMNTYGTTPGAVLVPGVNAFITNIPAVTQSAGPWTVDHTKTAGQTLGAIANYGTSPGAVLVPSTNAFVTNNVAVTLSAETVKVIGAVNQGTSPWVTNMTQWATTALGTPTNFGTTPGAVIAGSVNASLFSGTTALGAPNTFGTTAPTGNALGTNASLFIGTTLADGNSGNKSAGTQRTVLATDQPNLTTPLNINAAQINGVTPLMGTGNTGTGSPRVTVSTDQVAIALWGHGATGSAVPANGVHIGGDASGAAGAPVLTAPLVCDQYAKYDASTNGATELVALVASKLIYLCGYSFSSSSSTANTLKWVYGTGTNCATGQTAMTPGIVLQAAASTGPVGKVIPVSGFQRGLKTASANALCILTNAAQAAQAEVWYAQF